MTRPAAVLHVLGSAGEQATGIARIVENLARNLDPSRYRMSAAFLDGAGPLAQRIAAAGAEVETVCWNGGWRSARGAWRFRSALKRGDFDIVHSHVGGLFLPLISRASSRARLVMHFHSLRVESGKDYGRPRTHRGAHLVIANSRATARTLKGCDPVVIHPGLQLTEFPVRRTAVAELGGPVRIGVAARLVPAKGVKHLIQAIGLLRDEFPGLTLQIAGTGPERQLLEETAHIHGVGGRVEFLGWRNDLNNVMTGWSLYAQPSLEEGFGIAVVEAMATSLPVVCSDVGGLPEIVVDRETGRLVPPGDAAALAAAIREMIAEPALAERMGAAGRVRATSLFSAEREAREMRAVYDRLLA